MLHRVSATAAKLALLLPKVVHETLKHSVLGHLLCSGVSVGLEHIAEVIGHRLGGLEHLVEDGSGLGEGIEGRLGGREEGVMLSGELTQHVDLLNHLIGSRILSHGGLNLLKVHLLIY